MSDNGPNLWETLPEECKSMILSRLTNKEAARIARVSFEFLFCKFVFFFVFFCFPSLVLVMSIN